jgi:hypothetical protein
LIPPHSIVRKLFPEIESIYRAYQVLLLNYDSGGAFWRLLDFTDSRRRCRGAKVLLLPSLNSGRTRSLVRRKGANMAASSHKKATTKLPGRVQRVIKPHPDSGEPEKAQISVEGADHLYRELRVPNELTDEDGHQVKLKPGAEVEVKIEADDAVTVGSSSS